MGFVEASICIEKEKIVSITKLPSEQHADRVIDAEGNLVLPGMIDMHVHFRDPGSLEREDFETGTRSAAAGGVTTVADMPNTTPPVTSAEVFRDKRKIVEPKAVVDFALVAGAGSISSNAIVSLAEAGAVAFKTFMISRFKELAASDGQMLENFSVIAKTGRPCLVHAENENIVSWGLEKAKALGRVDPLAYAEFRPPIAEVEATMRTILLAEETSVRLHICHMTAKGAVDLLAWAKARGVKATGETSPNYLLLSSDALKKFGPYAKIDPPLRGPEHRKRLWEALREGILDVIASDHAPYTREEKEKGWKDIFEAPSGSVGVETTLPLMLDSVNRGLLTLERLVEAFSTNPAKILGLYPRKGVISIGADADLIIVDMKRGFEIRGENLHSKQRITPFEGYRGRGAPISTILRGETIMENGEVTGRPGYGTFLAPLNMKTL
jgi:dihydroorotase (multifunctional complex type)